MIYLDNSATTQLDPAVFEAMRPYWLGPPGNPSSRHAGGRLARRGVDRAREQIARAVRCKPNEIIFTSSATEANNLAILGTPLESGACIAIAPIEHPSCLQPAVQLEKRGQKVRRLAVDADGGVSLPEKQVADGVRLAVLQLANGETGRVQDVAAFRRVFPEETAVHCDAVQAVGRIPVDFDALGVDSMSVSGHKIHGPVGVAALIVRENARLRPQMFGGGQQRGFRPGTEPAALIVGLGEAMERAVEDLPAKTARMAELRDRFENQVFQRIPEVVRNGPRNPRLPNATNLSFRNAPFDPLLIALDLAGLCCSAGAACSSGSLERSAVLQAMGIEESRLDAALRFSVSRFTTFEEIDQSVEILAKAVDAVRRRVGCQHSKTPLLA